MWRKTCIMLCFPLCLLLAEQADAVPNFYISASSPQDIGGIISAGNDFAVEIWIDNEGPVEFCGGAFSLAFYSPDLSITELQHIGVTGGDGPYQSIEFLNNWEEMFNVLNEIHLCSWDESIPDTVSFVMVATTCIQPATPNLPYIRFNLYSSQEGTLCIDSLDHPDPSDQYDWLFGVEFEVVFNGPYCWNLEAAPFDGVKVVTNTANSGSHSLRWAIDNANLNPGPDTIMFDVSGQLTLSSPLPSLTDDSTVILGGTAPSGARSFIVDGEGIIPGLDIQSSYNQISELVLFDLFEYQLQINGDSNIVRGCYLNVDASGANSGFESNAVTILIGSERNIIGGCNTGDGNVVGGIITLSGDYNSLAGNLIGVSAEGEDPLNAGGIDCKSDHNQIGGTSTDCRNVIYPGIVIDGDENEVLNNFIGLNESGVDVLEPSFYGQTDIGIEVRGSLNRIGDENGNGNFIAGLFQAIQLWNGADSNLIFGNYTGTDINGRASLRMYRGGFNNWGKFNRIGDTLPGFANIICSCDSTAVEFTDGDSNIVRGNYIGTNPQGDLLGNATGIKFTMGTAVSNIIQKNIIANNVQNGIVIDSVTSSNRNTFSRNLIFNNGLLGIDLRDDGVTYNDPGDADTGPNDLLNYPEVDSIFMNPDSTFAVYGRAVENAIIEFFLAHPANDSSRPVDPSGFGEAYSFIGADSCDDDGEFVYDIPSSIAPFSRITTTATDTLGNTSEFSESFVLIAAPLIVVAYSPVNLRVTDPQGGYIGRDAFGVLTQTIFPATYTEENDSIHINYPLLGEYIIDVVLEDGASEDAIYSVGIRIDGTENCIIISEGQVPSEGAVTSLMYDVDEGYHYINGDVDRNETINILDIVYLVNYKFKGGAEPYPIGVADANCNLEVNILDIVYLVNYKFKGGPEPCAVEE